MRERTLIEKDLYEELNFAREALFSSKTLKEVKFWQQKIKYLEELIRKNNINRKK